MTNRQWVLTLICAATTVQAGPLEDILARSRHVADGVKDFTVVMTFRVQSTSARVPDSRVRIYYKAPDKFKPVPLDGDFTVLPRTYNFALGSVVDRLLEHHKPVLLAEQSIDGRAQHVIKLNPDEPGGPIQYHLLYLDRETYVVRRIRTYPANEAPVQLDVTHQRVSGFLMPTEVRVSGESAREVNGERQVERFSVTMKFDGYRVNTGLDDSIFRDEG